MISTLHDIKYGLSIIELEAHLKKVASPIHYTQEFALIATPSESIDISKGSMHCT